MGKIPIGGESADDEIYALDTAKPLHFFKNDRIGGITPEPHVGWLHRRMKHGNTLHSCGGLLRRSRPRRCKHYRAKEEVAPPHSITSLAPSRMFLSLIIHLITSCTGRPLKWMARRVHKGVKPRTI